jgi:hypothetical protein
MSFDFKLANGSFSLGPDGDIQRAYGQDKLSQDVVKIIATAVGSNLLHKWYGSGISDNLIGSGLKREFLEAEIIRSIGYSLQNLKALQEQQERAGQILLPSEAIKSIEDISILPTNDPRAIGITIAIRTRSGRIAQETLALRL